MNLQLEICSYRQYLTNLLKKKFSNARIEDIEDCVQNSLIKAIRHSDKFKKESSLKTWLSIIAIRMYSESFRKTYAKNEYLLESSEDLFVFDTISQEDFSETFCETDYQNKLSKELLSNLEDNMFVKTFSMHIFDDIEYKEIATKLNIPIGTVKGRIFRAKKLLQEKYREISYKYEETTV